MSLTTKLPRVVCSIVSKPKNEHLFGHIKKMLLLSSHQRSSEFFKECIKTKDQDVMELKWLLVSASIAGLLSSENENDDKTHI